MKFGLPISLAFHGVAFGLMWLTLENVQPLEAVADSYVPVELVTLGPETNIRATRKAPEPVETPEIITPQSKTPDAPVVIDETDDAVDEPVVNDNVDDIADPTEATRADNSAIGDDAPTEDITEDPNATPVDDETKDTRSASVDDKIADETKKKASFSLDDISSTVNKSRDNNPNANTQTLLVSEQNRIQFASIARAGAGQADGLTANLQDRLRSVLRDCWRMPTDAVNPEELVVSVRVNLDMRGEVTLAELDDPAAIARHPNRYMPIAAERAVNAVQKCAPYDFLPPETYAVWGEMVWNFGPQL